MLASLLVAAFFFVQVWALFTSPTYNQSTSYDYYGHYAGHEYNISTWDFLPVFQYASFNEQLELSHFNDRENYDPYYIQSVDDGAGNQVQQRIEAISCVDFYKKYSYLEDQAALDEFKASVGYLETMLCPDTDAFLV